MKLSEPVVRGLKQAARVALAAAVVNIGAAMGSGVWDVKILIAGAAIAAYEGASKYVATNPDINLKGLFPF